MLAYPFSPSLPKEVLWPCFAFSLYLVIVPKALGEKNGASSASHERRGKPQQEESMMTYPGFVVFVGPLNMTPLTDLKVRCITSPWRLYIGDPPWEEMTKLAGVTCCPMAWLLGCSGWDAVAGKLCLDTGGLKADCLVAGGPLASSWTAMFKGCRG